MPPAPHTNHYTTLNLPFFSALSDIKTSYRKLVLKYHPDKNLNDTSGVAAERFIAVNVAYKFLIDDVLRTEYDDVERGRVARELQDKVKVRDMDGKRKRMIGEMERREEEARATQMQSRNSWMGGKGGGNEGKRREREDLREQGEQHIRNFANQSSSSSSSTTTKVRTSDGINKNYSPATSTKKDPTLKSRSLKMKWTTSTGTDTKTDAEIEGESNSVNHTKQTLAALFVQYGEIELIVIADDSSNDDGERKKKSKKTKPKKHSATLTFKLHSTGIKAAVDDYKESKRKNGLTVSYLDSNAAMRDEVDIARRSRSPNNSSSNGVDNSGSSAARDEIKRNKERARVLKRMEVEDAGGVYHSDADDYDYDNADDYDAKSGTNDSNYFTIFPPEFKTIDYTYLSKHDGMSAVDILRDVELDVIVGMCGYNA